MTNITKLLIKADKIRLHAVVETPRGTAVNWNLARSFAFSLWQPLLVELTSLRPGIHPFDKGRRRDPFDVLVIHDFSRAKSLAVRGDFQEVRLPAWAIDKLRNSSRPPQSR